MKWIWMLVVFYAAVSRTEVHGMDGATAAGSFVTYEAFGAIGDGETDDLPAIRDAHAHANRHGLPVRSNPDATYHLGRQAITAIIATDTDWSTSRFLIDDSQGVEDHRASVFEVKSLLKPLDLKIDRLERDQDRLALRPETDCLVYVENRDNRIFIRRGLNQNDGTAQQEVFILRKDGSVIGGIDWDYDTITKIEVHPIDPTPLVIRGGDFLNIANRMPPPEGADSNYWQRNIQISRSHTVIDGVSLRVTGETDVGQPYSGFISIRQCADITLRNCSIDGRKTYHKSGAAGKQVAMGSYGYNASHVVNFWMINCRMEEINDRSRWGVIGTNFMKNVLLEDCELSRMDVHQGVSGTYIIRRTTLGHAGLNAIGRGRLIIEDSTLHGRHLVSFRPDYGSTWDGDVVIRNSRWIPRAGARTGPVMFGMDNDGTHDFGYPCSMPRRIWIDGLSVDDSNHPPGYQGLYLFGDPVGDSPARRPFPYALTESVRIRGLKTASGKPPGISPNPQLVEEIDVQVE